MRRRLDLVLDPGTFTEHDLGLESTDPLQFSDSRKYKDRIKSSQKSAGEGEAFISGIGRIAGREVSIGAFDFSFMGGSMGSVVGEKVTRIFERAHRPAHPRHHLLRQRRRADAGGDLLA